MYCGSNCQAEASYNSEKFKPVALAIFVKKDKQNKYKFHSNLLPIGSISVKAVLGLLIPDQYCQGDMKRG